jgi:16S rRNA C1402 (ribose-2'-O) methylase RsmI
LNTIARLAPRRRLALVCDLTQPTEVIVRGTARQALKQLDAVLSTQNITLILAGRKLTGGGRTRRD